jgi:outer membrane protein OmpA-like peptidoglycan-associated protein/tetratricopeptide (TPR) repeat protein
MRLKIFFSLCCLYLCCNAIAQTKKAENYFGVSQRYKSKKKNDRACATMLRAMKKDPTYAEAYSQLGQWYFEMHRFPEAAEIFRQASLKCSNGGMRFAKPYTKCLIYANNAEKALTLISTYATIKDSADWNRLLAQATFVKGAGHTLSAPWPVSIGERINSPYPELFPSMGVDTSTIFFTRRVNNQDDDFFQSSKDTCGAWYDTHNLGSPPNTLDMESAQYISADGHYLFFTRCENRSDDGYTEGGCDLYMAYRLANDSPWTQPEQFGFTINTTDYEGMPSLSPDVRELYFVSDRKGGYGGYDIWISRFEDGLWQPPVNAGPSINSKGNETAPYINLDNQTLYFTSDGWPGMGGTDLFMSHKEKDGSWTPAENLGYPINTANDERSECVSLDGKTLYFGSDRNGPAGNYDIMQTQLPPYLRPEPVNYIAGYVYDSLNKTRLNSASMYICNASSGDTLYHFMSNRGDASFIITLPSGPKYAIHTGHMEFIWVHDTIAFNKQYIAKPLIHNIPMLPWNYEDLKPINDSLIATLHFDVNIIDLSPADKAALSDALAPWSQTKNYMVVVNAYTDNTGNPLLNEELSYKRAGIVSKEILSMGVDETAVLSKGWGEAKMIATNETDEGRRTNRRVEVRIRR